MPAKRVIVVTDGDHTALSAVEKAASNIHGRCISLSGGHVKGDAYLTADDLIELIMSAPYDPVVVMFDDEGDVLQGRGEQLLQELAQNPQINIIGAVAVASDTKGAAGVKPDVSVARDGSLVEKAVNKAGEPVKGKLRGDTVGVLAKLPIPIIVGLGDPGKMDYADDARNGAPITTKALQVIMEQNQHSMVH